MPGKSWDGVRSATETPNMCPQLLFNEDVIGNEDCLYLNVYSPIVNFNSTLVSLNFHFLIFDQIYEYKEIIIVSGEKQS